MLSSSPAHADRRLWAALATAFMWHGGMLLGGSYERTYDAYIHMFFADHYARDWFSTWETRWYTGFTITSYPPGTHQLIALLSKIFSLETAFVLVQLSAVLLLIVGVYRFSRIWVDPVSAGWAALLASVSTSLAEVVHVFGQLPTTFSLAMLLNTLPSIFVWVRDGSRGDLVLACAGLAATTAAHHVTTLFGAVFFVGPVVATALLDQFRCPHPDEKPGHCARVDRYSLWPAIARRSRRVLPGLVRAGVIGTAAIAILVIVVLPYWLWSASDPIVQIPIPHATRDSFIENGAAGIVFFVVPWGLMVLMLPFALMRSVFTRALPLAASVALLFILGTGGTTPIPRLLLRSAFDILTLDRFTVWATIGVLPLVGALVTSMTDGRLNTIATSLLGRRTWKAVLLGGACGLMVASVLAANFAQFRPLQPDRIDPEPIAAFMDKDQHDRWRYLTLGFGDQMARVAAETTATTVDGNYHSARRLPELTSRSVERLEGAKFRGVPGLGSLQQFLATPERYNLKFVFSNDVFYDPLLWASGWHRLDRLRNGIVVWEREDIPPLPDLLPTKELPDWQRVMWGTLPMSALAAAALTQLWNVVGRPNPQSAQWAARQVRSLGPTPVARILTWIDRRLARAAQRASSGHPRHRWYRDVTETYLQRLDRLAERRAPSLRLRLACCALIGALGFGLWQMTSADLGATDAEATVESWYDDLDFQRFSDAWNRLDPQARPPFDQFSLERSVVDGLVAGYSKLDRVDTALVSSTSDRATVRASLSYVTSLTRYDTVVDHQLRRVDGQWWIVPFQSDVSTTPDQFSRSTEVTYLSQGRRQVTADQTGFGDVLDRPRIETLSAQAVYRDGRFAVVGEITNLDVDPADITVTARFLGEDGETLVEHNAALVTASKVLPRETVPFRIDIEAIAGAADAKDEAAGEFQPDLFATPDLGPRDIANIELITKAVVTGRDLQRDLQPQHLRVVVDDTVTLLGELRNDGVETATVPQVLITLIDEEGNVGWVDSVWIDQAIRPQRIGSFSVELTKPDVLTALDVPLIVYGNGITRSEGNPFSSDAVIELPPESGWASARITVQSFYRASS